MTIQQCKYTLAIARCGSMNEAAKTMGVSQASLSSALKELEEEFNVRIFDRSNKGVKLTRDGAEFIRYARQLIAQYEVIIDRYDNGNIKNVRNFAVTSQHYDFAAEAFVKFMDGFDGEYNISLKEARTAEVISDVMNMRSDIGILAYLKSTNNIYMERYLRRSGLKYHKLLETTPYVFLRKNHPLAHKEQLFPKDLSEFPYVTYDQGENGPVSFAEEFYENNRASRQVRINDRATLMNLLLSTNSYTIGTGIMSSELNNNGSVVSVRMSSPDIYSIVVINRADMGLSEDAQRYMHLLDETLSHRNTAAPSEINE